MSSTETLFFYVFVETECREYRFLSIVLFSLKDTGLCMPRSERVSKTLCHKSSLVEGFYEAR